MCAIGVVALLALVPAPPAGASQKSDCRDDPSVSIKVCITQNYDQTPIGGHTYTRVQSYQFSWTRTDPQVVMSHAKAHAGVCCRVLNDGSMARTEDYDIGFPSSGQVYTEVPSWHDRDVETDCTHCYQCGSQEVRISRRTQSWTFAFNVCTGTL
jgi:hypothetical protein